MKLRRKLIAAGFAFGATALTLTTSTFAWYTSNTEAKVTEISGMTSATVDASSFYVANAKTYSNDGKATDFTDYGSKATPVLTGGSESDHELTPVAWRGKVTRTTTEGTTTTVTTDSTFTNYVPMGGTKYVKGSEQGAEDTGPDNTVVYDPYDANNVYEYVLRFRMANNKTTVTPLYFSEFNLTSSKQSGYKAQTALATGADDTGISQTGSYFAELVKALKLTITVQNLEASTETGNVGGFVPTGNATSTVYDLEKLATPDSDSNIATGKANAVGYYNKVLNKAIAATSDETVPTASLKKIEKLATAASTDAVSFASIPSTGYVEVRFTFWLDGWDEYCYDVMLQQGFKFSFVATTEAGKSVIKTAASA